MESGDLFQKCLIFYHLLNHPASLLSMPGTFPFLVFLIACCISCSVQGSYDPCSIIGGTLSFSGPSVPNYPSRIAFAISLHSNLCSSSVLIAVMSPFVFTVSQCCLYTNPFTHHRSVSLHSPFNYCSSPSRTFLCTSSFLPYTPSSLEPVLIDIFPADASCGVC